MFHYATKFIGCLGKSFAWQGAPEKAAVAGEYTLLENEVEPVVKAHCWGVGPAEKLAKGLKAALNQLRQ
jgi:hypothetical protein